MQGFDPQANGRQSPIPAFEPAEAANPSPRRDVPMEEHEAISPRTPHALLACLQAFAQRAMRDKAAAGEGGGSGLHQSRLHYRIHCPAAGPGTSHRENPRIGSDANPGIGGNGGVDDLFDRTALAAGLAAMSPPLPQSWREALLRGWPERLRGLHRIELEPGAAWVSVEMGLREARERRRLQARRQAVPQPTASAARDAIVVGAGLAGCAMADALARRGWRVIVIEGAAGVGGAVAGIPLLAQHPALSPGADRRSRLLIAALLASRRLAERFGAAANWCGRFQPMPIDEARLRTAGVPAAIAQPVAHSSTSLHGVDGLPGIWFPACAMIDPQAWWRRVLQSRDVQMHLSQPVAGIVRQAERWLACDAHAQPIASAAVMILANQADALALAAMPPEATARLRRSRIQVAIGGAPAGLAGPTGAAAGSRPPAILGGASYRLEDPGRCCVIGPLEPGIDSLAHHRIELPAPTIGDPAYRWRISEPGERLLMRDNLPMIGPVPAIDVITAQRARFERNDRLPLPRRESRHLLAGLGGRGLLWSVIGAEIIAAQVNHEPPVVEPELEDAVDPARFLKRSLRRARPQADGMKLLSS